MKELRIKIANDMSKEEEIGIVNKLRDAFVEHPDNYLAHFFSGELVDWMIREIGNDSGCDLWNDYTITMKEVNNKHAVVLEMERALSVFVLDKGLAIDPMARKQAVKAIKKYNAGFDERLDIGEVQSNRLKLLLDGENHLKMVDEEILKLKSDIQQHNESFTVAMNDLAEAEDDAAALRMKNRDLEQDVLKLKARIYDLQNSE